VQCPPDSPNVGFEPVLLFCRRFVLWSQAKYIWFSPEEVTEREKRFHSDKFRSRLRTFGGVWIGVKLPALLCRHLDSFNRYLKQTQLVRWSRLLRHRGRFAPARRHVLDAPFDRRPPGRARLLSDDVSGRMEPPLPSLDRMQVAEVLRWEGGWRRRHDSNRFVWLSSDVCWAAEPDIASVELRNRILLLIFRLAQFFLPRVTVVWHSLQILTVKCCSHRYIDRS